MAKYRRSDVESGQGLLLAINLKEQLLPGTFEYMLEDIITTKIDTSMFDRKYKNDHTGASAVPPVVLLKLILYGYSKGCMSSRGIWELNKNNIIAKALTGDMDMHWTTIADFISGNSKEFGEVFVKVLTYCNELGLVGGETFAIDGLRLPSNASIEMSGTKKQLEKRLQMYRRMAQKHVERHIKKDERGELEEGAKERFEQRQKYLDQRMQKISSFLEQRDEKLGKCGQEIQSNVTDNESAMMHSGKGIIQGYIGIAVTDKNNQIIVNAEAVGSANEGEHLAGLLDSSKENLQRAGVKEIEKRTILADSNYFSEENLCICEQRGIEALIPDIQHTRRRAQSDERKRYEVEDFIYNETGNYYQCPQGKTLASKGTTKLRGGEGKMYQASLTNCRVCPKFSQCIRTKKDRTQINQGRKIMITKSNEPGNLCAMMRRKLSTEECQQKYSFRIQIAEPVFSNIAYCKGLNRFTLRGKQKVNGQWQLYCMLHNLGKCLPAYTEERKKA